MSGKFEEMIAINAEKKRDGFSFRGRYFQSESHVCAIKTAPTDKTEQSDSVCYFSAHSYIYSKENRRIEGKAFPIQLFPRSDGQKSVD